MHVVQKDFSKRRKVSLLACQLAPCQPCFRYLSETNFPLGRMEIVYLQSRHIHHETVDVQICLSGELPLCARAHRIKTSETNTAGERRIALTDYHLTLFIARICLYSRSGDLYILSDLVLYAHDIYPYKSGVSRFDFYYIIYDTQRMMSPKRDNIYRANSFS